MKKDFTVTDFGAVSGSGTLQTDKLQKAIDCCFAEGGGTVVIPGGEYLTGDIRLRSNVTLYLKSGAKLCGSKNPEDYFNYLSDGVQPLEKSQITDAPYVHLSTIHGETQYETDKKEYRFKRIFGSRWNNAIIRAFNAENIRIIGESGSAIDGCNCFDEIGEENYRGPHGMTFFGCSNIELCGYTIQNTGNWAHNLLFCKNIDVHGITALAGHDGFDASVCENLTVRDSGFYTGDDCIAGFGNVNVHISGCELNSSCNALRFGGTNVLVEKSHIFGPGKYSFRGSLSDEEKRSSAPSSGGRTNMLSAFTYYADYSLPIAVQPGGIVISGCKIETADRLLHYNYSGNETWQKHRPLESIAFKDITADGISMPANAYGDGDIPLMLVLENVRIGLREGFESIDFIHACNYERIIMKNVSAPGLCGKSVVKRWSDGEINISGCNFGAAENTVTDAEEKFFAEAI